MELNSRILVSGMHLINRSVNELNSKLFGLLQLEYFELKLDAHLIITYYRPKFKFTSLYYIYQIEDL